MSKERTTSPAAETSRRGFLKCLAWAGTGIAWTVSGGVPRGFAIGEAQARPVEGFTFVQISDSHLGFRFPGAAGGPDTAGILQGALDQVANMEKPPALILHTGDVTHLATAAQFDTADQILKGAKIDVHYTPGEHDVIGDGGRQFFERFGKEMGPGGWYSFDQGGIHFVSMCNVLSFERTLAGGIGPDQLKWLEADLADRGSSTPIVVFTHVPMWSIYMRWGWGTQDAPQALDLLKRFGSVTILNGHIHQVMQKVEGNVRLSTALSTAFPRPPAGRGAGPAPMQVAADRLKSMLGVRQVDFAPAIGMTVSDTTLG